MDPQPSSAPRLPTVIVLASGRGERFRAAGGAGHKLQASLAGATVLAHTLAAVRASGLPWHLEDVGHPGMGDSIAAAVRATPRAAGWLILPADLPLVRADTLRKVAAALMGAAAGDGPEAHGLRAAQTVQTVQTGQTAQAAQPRYKGQRGHPVGFAAGCREALAALSGNFGAAPVLRALREAGQVLEIEVDDVGIVTDIDTPEELARAETLMRVRLGEGEGEGEGR